MSDLARRLHSLRQRIDAALGRRGAAARAITIVAVTKGHPAARIEEAARLGLLEIGENRVAEALSKAPHVTSPVRWHLIGHLQRNKVARAVTLFSTIHSCDSPRLVEALGETGVPLDIFLQVNVSGEGSKQGVAPEGVADLWRGALAQPSLRVVGLMTMAPLGDDPEAARPVFRGLRQIRDDLNRRGDGPPLSALSMGMSGDFEVAVEEGATHLRIGTLLLGAIAAGNG